MPELPEVETVVRGLREPLVGHVIEEVWFDWQKVIATPSPNEFSERIIGKTIQAVKRRAKYILCELGEGEYFIVHLKMTGRLYVADDDRVYDADRYVHFYLQLDKDKQLRFSDPRKFGRVYFTDQLQSIMGKLGPEPLESSFTVDVLKERLDGRRKVIKALLLDQSFIAGVGNIYADEALHNAKIHPERPANTLTDAEITRLHQTIREALQRGIQHEGASINWYRKPDGEKGNSQNHFSVYGRDGQSCLNCGATIEKIRVAQRGTHYCPDCQPKIKL